MIFFKFPRLVWNYGAIILSLAINLLMLITWNAKASLEDIQKASPSGNNTSAAPIPWHVISEYVTAGIICIVCYVCHV